MGAQVSAIGRRARIHCFPTPALRRCSAPEAGASPPASGACTQSASAKPQLEGGGETRRLKRSLASVFLLRGTRCVAHFEGPQESRKCRVYQGE
eukprot:6300055-Pyramimonas_sp.AAC.2